jgi:hypothetical protein
MANIAEMVKELQQERDRLDQAIGALAPLAGISNTSFRARWTEWAASDSVRSCAEESFSRAEGSVGKTASGELCERST